jgi:hypothetical protein
MQNPQRKERKDAHYSRAPVQGDLGQKKLVPYDIDGEIPKAKPETVHASQHVQERHVRGWGSALGQKIIEE